MEVREMVEKEKFMGLLEKIKGITGGPGSKDDKLKAVCGTLKDGVPHYDWVGFYLVGGERELVLGPFVGEPTEHTRIAFGQGICGQAAERGETFLVQDVSRESNYLSCSPAVKSEIVVPMFKEGKIIGELDIDSHELSPFTREDREFLESVCEIVAGLF